METILVTGARAPVALELARAFHSSGHRVILADSMRMPLARWCNASAIYYGLPSPRFHATAFTTALQDIIKTENVTHLIPTCEETFYVAAWRDSFSCKTWTADLACLQRLHHKLEFTKYAAADFTFPETRLLADFTDWNNSEAYVFKPCYSRFAATTIIGKKITAEHFTENEKTHWVAQRRIFGKEMCVYSIWNNGELKAYAAYHPLYRAGKGAGIFFEPCTNEPLFRQVAAFGKRINYTGQLSFDVIVDENNIPHVIECNPRGTSGVHSLRGKLADAFLQPGACVFPVETAYALKTVLAFLKPGVLFSKHVRAANDAVFSSCDPLPALLQPLAFAEFVARKIRYRTSLLGASTVDIEWNGEPINTRP
jgi:hypothetical protein